MASSVEGTRSSTKDIALTKGTSKVRPEQDGRLRVDAKVSSEKTMEISRHSVSTGYIFGVREGTLERQLPSRRNSFSKGQASVK